MKQKYSYYLNNCAIAGQARNDESSYTFNDSVIIAPVRNDENSSIFCDDEIAEQVRNDGNRVSLSASGWIWIKRLACFLFLSNILLHRNKRKEYVVRGDA